MESKNCTNKESNSSEENLYNLKRDYFEEINCIDHTFNSLDRSRFIKAEYERALSISDENDFQLHFKSPPNFCFVKKLFFEGNIYMENKFRYRDFRNLDLEI